MSLKLTSAQKGMAVLVCALALAPNLASAQIKVGDNPTQKVPGARLQVDGDATTTTPAKLIVTGTGNTGIGTAAPGTTLDVNGAITNRETAVAVAANAATIPANVSQVQLTGAATANVAVTAPAAPNAGQRLVVYNNTTGGFAATLNSIAIPAGQAMEFVYSNGGWRSTSAPAAGASVNLYNADGTLTGNRVVTQGASTLAFTGTAVNAFSVDGTTLSVDAAGNKVGIGTAAPGQTLSVSDPAAGIGIPVSILQPNLPANSSSYIKFGKAFSTNDAVDIAFSNAGTGSTENYLSIGFSGAPAIAATFKANGNVGIGTTAPAQKLDVNGAARISGSAGVATNLMGRNASGDVSNLTLGTGLSITAGTLNIANPTTAWNLLGNAGTNAATNFIGTTDGVDFVTRTSNAERMRVTAAGNVGIGTNAPVANLDVIAGTVGFRNAGAGTWDNLWFNVDPAAPSINASGADGGLQFKVGANAVGTYGNGQTLTTVATMLANGNVGIGTTTPGQQLTVVDRTNSNQYNGTASFLANTLGSGVGIGWNGIQAIGSNGNNSLQLNAQPAGHVLLQAGGGANGNVGIGTTAPAQKLHVEGTARITGSTGAATNIMGRDANGDISNLTLGTGLSITAGTLNASGAGWSLLGNAGTNAATNFVGTTDNQGFTIRTNNAQRVRVSETGNVGIGTTTPGQTLSVSDPNTGSIATASIIQPNLGVGNGNYLKLGKSLATANDAADIAFFNQGAGSTENYLSLGFSGNPVTVAAFKANGNVGIGTTTPGQQLTVVDRTNSNQYNGTASFLANNLTAGVGIGYSGLQAIGTNGNNSLMLNAQPGGNVLLQASGGANGNVGIGTLAPDQLLSVNGNASKSAGGTAWAVFSDKRLKKDIHPFTDGLQQVMQIKPVFFKYNGKGGLNPSEKDEIGIIAQEMQQIAPYAVTQTDRKIDESGKGALQFDRAESVTYMLVNAVKEQQAMIEKQQQLIEKQQQQIEKMNEQNTRLTAEVEVIKKEVNTGKYSVK